MPGEGCYSFTSFHLDPTRFGSRNPRNHPAKRLGFGEVSPDHKTARDVNHGFNGGDGVLRKFYDEFPFHNLPAQSPGLPAQANFAAWKFFHN
jgi:hypothetical protein